MTRPLHVGYLMNQHPYASCTFIRREIREIEAAGIKVSRFSIRWPETVLIDPADRQEVQKTRYILKGGPWRILGGLLAVLIGRPGRLLGAARLAMRVGWRAGRTLRHLAYLAEACVVLRWCRAMDIDHVHAHFGTNTAMVAMLCRILGGPAYSFTVHGPEEFDNPTGFALREKVRHAAFVVAVAHYGRSQLYRCSSSADWPKIRIVRCGVDEVFLEERFRPVPDVPRLVCVARLSEAKGHPVLVEAASRLVAEGLDFEMVLIGDGPMRAEIENQVAAGRLQNRVRLLGWRSGAEVREEILSARALVLPSFGEGLPVVIMEALALGRPVISTYIAGIPELVKPGINGWLVPAGSVDDLVEAIRQALTAPPQRLEEMGRAGAALVRQNHDARAEARKLAELFRAAAAGSPAHPAGSEAPANARLV